MIGNKMNMQDGFTLIELVATLILVGIMAAVGGSALVTGVQGYLLASENSVVTQKAQLALSRISREILQCQDCDDTKDYSLSSPFSFEVTSLGTRSLELDSSELKLGPDGGTLQTLVDQVAAFSMDIEPDGRITITLEMDHRQGGGTMPAFETKVYPRNTYRN